MIYFVYMKPKLKRLSKAEKESIQAEFDKGFDFKAARRKGIFINLDEDVITYFKNLALETGRGYQPLIQDALKYFKEKNLKPKTSWE